MDEEIPHIEVRAIAVSDAPKLFYLDENFETDQIYTLRVCNRLMRDDGKPLEKEQPVFSFELIETPVDPPLYKNHRPYRRTLEELEQHLQRYEGGYVAIANGAIAGGILLSIEEWRSVARIEDLIVGRQFRRYGIGSLLLSCAADWARKRDCWALMLETQNVNYPAIQFYLRNGLEIWSIHRHFYPPGADAHEVAIMMGKRLASTTDA